MLMHENEYQKYRILILCSQKPATGICPNQEGLFLKIITPNFVHPYVLKKMKHYFLRVDRSTPSG